MTQKGLMLIGYAEGRPAAIKDVHGTMPSIIADALKVDAKRMRNAGLGMVATELELIAAWIEGNTK